MSIDTYENIRLHALRLAGEVASSSSKYYSKTLDYLEIAQNDVLSSSNKFDLSFSRAWPWAIESDPIHVVLKTAFSTGEISLLNSSVNGVFSDPPSTSMAGRHLFIVGRSEVYRIATHVASAAAFTLDSAFIGSSDDYGFIARKLVYDLGSNVLRLCDAIDCFVSNGNEDNEYKIFNLPLDKFKRDWPVSHVDDRMPNLFTVLTERDTSYSIQLNASVTEETKIDVPYIKKPTSPITTSESPLVPLRDREILSLLVASMLCYMEKSDQEKGSIYFNMAKAKLKAMEEQHTKDLAKTGNNFARLIPRPSGLIKPYRFDF